MSWGTQDRQQRRYYCFHVRDYYPLGFCFPANSINRIFFNFSHINTKLSPYNPDHKLYAQNIFAQSLWSVWAVSFSLATTNEMLSLRTLFYFPPGTEMFYFPGFASRIKCVDSHKWLSFLIRKSSDQRLLGTSPKLIAAMLRPSSLFWAKASTIYS